MDELKYQPLPLTSDRSIMECCRLVGLIRGKVADLVLSVVNQAATSCPIDKYGKTSLLLIQRALECLGSIELLIVLERERDAAVLLVTLLELSYDIRFLEQQPHRIEEWIGHHDHNRKPRRVGQLLQALYVDKSELSAAKAVYEWCSMIKHVNPAGGTLTMPFGVDGRMIMARRKNTRDLLAAYAFTAGGTVFESAVAARKIWHARDSRSTRTHLKKRGANSVKTRRSALFPSSVASSRMQKIIRVTRLEAGDSID